jgi:hypothetical protein
MLIQLLRNTKADGSRRRCCVMESGCGNSVNFENLNENENLMNLKLLLFLLLACVVSTQNTIFCDVQELTAMAATAPLGITRTLETPRKFGWQRQHADERDWKYTPRAIADAGVPLPKSIDLRTTIVTPAPYDQGSLGSCTANGIAFAYQFAELKQQLPNVFQPSRLFIYYNERVIEGTVNEDAGAMIRDGFKSINQTGVCDELIWPYAIEKFAERPPAKCYEQASRCKSVAYYAVQPNVQAMKQALVDGFPVVYGFDVYTSFETILRSGLMPYPNVKTEELLGGHCVTAVGYDDTKGNDGCFIVRNSWGTSWGDRGYFYMPYKVVATLGMTADYWVVTKVQNDVSPTPTPTPTPVPPPVPIPNITPLLISSLSAITSQLQQLVAQLQNAAPPVPAPQQNQQGNSSRRKRKPRRVL